MTVLHLRATACVALWLGAVAAAFPPATVTTASNGLLVASQNSPDTPLVGIQVFLPAGTAQQPVDRAGVAAVTAAVVARTPVDGGSSASDVATSLGASLTYTIDPLDTRFSIECKADDAPRLLHDLDAALRRPDVAQLDAARASAMAAASAAIKDPALTAYAMMRQALYPGAAYGRPDYGSPTSLQTLTANDVVAFAGQYRHGQGAVVSLAGNVTAQAAAAAQTAFGDFAANPAPQGAAPSAAQHSREVVAHRDVATPWVAIGYAAPTQFSSDFPAMLVLEALLGRGGGVHAFSTGSDAEPPDDYAGGYYQFEAQPGLFVEFFSGSNIDRDVRDLETGVTRLRGSPLPAALLNKAKTAALGSFLTSVASLDDASWLVGRAAMSPSGAAFENALPARIAAVTGADVQRVAKKYLTGETIAVVLPTASGQ